MPTYIGTCSKIQSVIAVTEHVPMEVSRHLLNESTAHGYTLLAAAGRQLGVERPVLAQVPRAQGRDERARVGVVEDLGDRRLGFGRIIVSEIEAPNMFAIPVESG